MEILMKPTLGKAVNKDKVIKSPLYDLLCYKIVSYKMY